MNEEIEKLRQLTNISTNILMNINIHGIITYCNKRCFILFSKSELKGSSIDNIFNKENAFQIKKSVAATIIQEIPHSFQINEQCRNYNIYIYPHNKEAAVCIEDITERIQISHLLAETTRRMNFAEQIANLGYWEVDIKAKKIFWSVEMFRIFGIKEEQISVKRNIIKEQIIKEDIPIYKEKLIKLLKSEKPVEGKLRIKRTDNTIAHCLFKAEISSLSNKKKIIGTLQDITPLETAKNKAEQQNKDKSRFLAQASHDIRQPMQTISLLVEHLLDDNLTKEQFSIVDKIHNSTENLRNLLNNLLDMSRLEIGGFSIVKENIDIGKLLFNISKEYQTIAAHKNISLKLINCHYIIKSDAILIERIIRNFLNNALKYSKDKILIGCRISKTKHQIKIIVMDNGVGIRSTELEKIFEEFYQSKEVPENKKQGSGLGLTIVKKIAKLLNAQVGVYSQFGKGSCFYLELSI